jgi:hypothetical protein
MILASCSELHASPLRGNHFADGRNIEVRSFERDLQPFRNFLVEIPDFPEEHFENNARRLPQTGVVEDLQKLNPPRCSHETR